MAVNFLRRYSVATECRRKKFNGVQTQRNAVVENLAMVARNITLP